MAGVRETGPLDHEKRGHKKAGGFRNVDLDNNGSNQLNRT